MPSRFLVEREEKSNIPQSKIRDFRQRLRASGRGSDSLPGCHSLPRLRFAYPLGKGARLWCRQSRRIKINRADDIRPYGQYITFSYSIVGGGASTPRRKFSTFIFQLSIENRSSEGTVIASRLISGVAIRNPCRHRRRGALHRRKTDSHDQFTNWSRNDKGRDPVPYFHIFRNDELALP